jgi:hypothetical protein
MKKHAILGGVCVGFLVICVAIVFWPRTPRGEYRSERGMIYHFSDGVVAIDTTRTPHEFYIYASHPEDKAIEKVEIVDDGLHITGPGIANGAEGFMGAELSVGYTMPKLPGKVRVVISHGDSSDGRQMAIAPETILDFIEKGDWDASVRQLWEK